MTSPSVLLDAHDRPAPSLRSRLGATWGRLRRGVLRRRRGLAAVLTGAAVLAGASVTRTPAPPTTPVVVATRDLPAGGVLTASDLRVARTVDDAAPEAAVGTVDVLLGRALAGPVGAGEPVTPARVVGAGLADSYPTRVAVPVRLPDPGMAGLLEVGDLVDLLATDPADGRVTSLAQAVPVLALPVDEPGSTSTSALPGSLVVLALTPTDVAAVSAATLASFVTFTWSRR